MPPFAGRAARRAVETGDIRTAVLLLALTAATGRADTIALGPHGGICLDCGDADQMHWLGAIAEGEHAFSPWLVARVEVAADQLSLSSDECQYEATGTRLLAAAGLRVSSTQTPGFFAALTAGGLAAHSKSTCPRSRFDTFFGAVVRPQLGWDVLLAPRRWLRLEIAADVQWESDFYGAKPAVELGGGAVFVFGN